MVNSGPIEFLLGFPLNIDVNGGQTKFEVHISKNMAKIANGPKSTLKLLLHVQAITPNP